MGQKNFEKFKALSVETRIEIIQILRQKENAGCKEIAELLDITPAAASQHLKVLKESGLISCERQGYHIPYSVDEKAFEILQQDMKNICICCHKHSNGDMKLDYIDFGKRTGLKVTPASIGAMRLPKEGIDAVELMRHAIDSGMRYIDTSRGYGESEFIVGKALKDGYREKVILSTKSSPWCIKVHDTDDGSADSVRRRIEESLVRLDTDYLDFYQVWSLQTEENWELATKKGGMVEGIKKAQDEGLVRHIGFTTHQKPEDVVKNLPSADWAEVILVSYNLLNKNYVPVLEKAHELGIGTIVMNPVGGGKFAGCSKVFDGIIKEVGADSLVDMAIRYVLSNPHVDTIINGISKISDVDSTIDSARKPDFSESDLRKIDNFMDELSSDNVNYCTGCKYCMPCPVGINIPSLMGLIYEDRYLGFKEDSKKAYNTPWRVKVKADACIKCGKCEKQCTQKLDIIKDLEYAHSEYNDK